MSSVISDSVGNYKNNNDWLIIVRASDGSYTIVDVVYLLDVNDKTNMVTVYRGGNIITCFVGTIDKVDGTIIIRAVDSSWVISVRQDTARIEVGQFDKLPTEKDQKIPDYSSDIDPPHPKRIKVGTSRFGY